MTDLKSQISALHALAHELIYLGADDAPVYSDHFHSLNRDVYRQADALYAFHGATPEEEASLCLALLMGYNATAYDNGEKQERIQEILNRSWKVLDNLPASLLKVNLLTYCYGEIFDEELSREAHTIIYSWSDRDLIAEELEVIELLENFERTPYPWTEVGD